MVVSAVVGIDLGTTTTLLSVYFPDKGAEIMENDAGDLFTASVIAIDKKELALPSGQARKTKVGKIAENCSVGNWVLISDAKRIIGKKLYDGDVSKIRSCFKYPLVADTSGSAVIQIPLEDAEGTHVNLYPQVVSAEVLKYMTRCYKKKFPATTTLRAVVTIPAVFKETQRAATYEAAKIAGIDIVQLVSEPTAAAVQYLCGGESSMRDVNKNGNFLVFDLGGGTLDVSIVEATNEGKNITVKAVDGDPLLGGRDFDNYIEPILLNEYNINLEVNETTGTKQRKDREQARKNFMLACRELKEALSSTEQTELSIGSFWKGEVDNDEDITISRATFTKELVDRNMADAILCPINGALKKAQMKKEELSGVFLAGGGCRMPIICEWLKKFFGAIPIYQARNVGHVVSQGASVMGYIVGVTESIQVSDSESTPLPKVTESLNYSLGLETAGNKMGWILKRGTLLPATDTQIFTNVVDNQKLAKLSIRQGDSDMASANVLIYENTNLALTPMPARTSKISVTYKMDVSMILAVTAFDTTRPDKSVSFTVPLPGRINAENIQRLASGDICSSTDINPVEAKLKDITTHYYKTLTNVQNLPNMATRKSFHKDLQVVGSFVHGARGDAIGAEDVKKMDSILTDIEAGILKEEDSPGNKMRASFDGKRLGKVSTQNPKLSASIKK